MKLRIKRRLVRILVEDVGSRDEKLARMDREANQLREELSQAEEEAAKARVDLNKVRHHELNRYFIPVSLLVALITGGMIAAQVQSLPGLATLRWVALAFLIAYFAYYVWVYYISSSLSE
jgi:sterol desaturase/sphingolipid hydroxylase (fatty acid hydroxylase superfamily)